MKPVIAGDGYGCTGDSVTALGADPWTLGALEFLERSREVANEVVVDETRAETSTSGREKIAAPGTRSAV